MASFSSLMSFIILAGLCSCVTCWAISSHRHFGLWSDSRGTGPPFRLKEAGFDTYHSHIPLDRDTPSCAISRKQIPHGPDRASDASSRKEPRTYPREQLKAQQIGLPPSPFPATHYLGLSEPGRLLARAPAYRPDPLLWHTITVLRSAWWSPSHSS